MKIVGAVVLTLIVVVALTGMVAYLIGSRLPVDHVTSVSGTVPSSPEKTFALITNISAAPTWRHDVKSVIILAPDQGRDHWIENLGHGTSMNFLATRTDPVTHSGPDIGHARRDVLLTDKSFGGTWSYQLSPGAAANETDLRITETGYINPPLYRFMMAHVFGPTKNLDRYMTDLKTASIKPST